MADIRVTCRVSENTTGELRGLPERITREMKEATREAGNILYRHELAAIRKKTGRTAGDIDKDYDDSGPTSAQAEVFIKNPVGSYLHHGTGRYGPNRRAYDITPRLKKALHWPGARHPVRGPIMHPGMRGDLWMQRGGERAEPEIAAEYETRINRALG